ncbi:MAG: GNAT family protein [Bacteroidia bacterium]
MKEAGLAMLNAMTQTWELNRIEGFVESNNTACKRAIMSMGFVYEGTMRECEEKDGTWISLDIFAYIPI